MEVPTMSKLLVILCLITAGVIMIYILPYPTVKHLIADRGESGLFCNQSVSILVHSATTSEDGDYNATAEFKDILRTNLLWMQKATITPQIMQTQLERISLTRKACRERMPRFSARFQGRYLYLSFRNVASTLLPKTGSSNILRVICILVGNKCTKITGYPDEHHYVPRFTQGISSLNRFTEEMNNWSSRPFFYVFVRNPWQRLVSTYIQKVLYTNFYVTMCGRYKNTRFTEYQRKKKAANETFTFQDFLEYFVIEHYRLGGINGMEPHYKPQSLAGTFCDVSYSFIGKTETYDEDIKVVLEQYGVKDIPAMIEETKKFRRPNEKANTTSKSYLKLWKSVDTDTIHKIRDIYTIDFAMFDYPRSPL